MENISNISGNFVFDMDEVLVDISALQYSFIRNNWSFFSQYFKDLGPLTRENILARPEFYLDEWLIKDEYKNDKPTRKIVKDFIIRNFFNTNFYKLLKPTKFAVKTVMNRAFMEHVRVKKVYILTRTLSDEMSNNKKEFIDKYFNHPKVETVFVKSNEKKSDVLKSKNVSWNLFADDEVRNIVDFVSNFDIKGKEFLIPKTGYNKIPLALDLVIKEKGGVYSYFDKEA
jgi:hypothetical protein